MHTDSAARVLILFNEPTLPADHRDADSEHEIVYTADNVERVLRDAGHDVARLGVNVEPGALVDGVRAANPDVVFNLFEGLPGHGETEAYAAGVLEWLGLPYTGCPHQPIALARNKPLTKLLLRGAGLPTAKHFTVDALPVPRCPLRFPVIVKPSNQDASVGVDQGSVVRSQRALNARVADLLDRYGGPILVERFIGGREFSVAVIETPDRRTLPIGEILFQSVDPDAWPIVTYDSKWKPGSADYDTQPPVYPDDLSPGLEASLNDLALRAFELLGCRDYARVDFRVDAEGRPFILELNPNPDFSPIAGLAGSLDYAGLTWDGFVVQLVRNATARGRREPVVAACDALIAW